MELLPYILCASAGYLIGSVPTGFLIAKARGIDIRTAGSGNIGATNVFRILGKGPGIFVLFVDALKGFISAAFIPALLLGTLDCGCELSAAPRLALIAGIGAILGHNFTCWLKFKGGKGIATSAGVFLSLSPMTLGITLGVWICVYTLSRYGSLASIIAAVTLPIAAGLTKSDPIITILAAILGLLAIWRHKANIGRLLKGTEYKTGKQTVEQNQSVPKRITVLGAGAWGTALTKLLTENGHTVTLWGHDTARLETIANTGRNERLPNIQLPVPVRIEKHLITAASNADYIIVAVPSQFVRAITSQLPQFSGVAISVTKGIEFDTGMTMSDILTQTMPLADNAVLSGPSFAIEVARGVPTAVVVASHNSTTAREVQALFHRPTFRVYTSTDIRGVELAGALKNVMGIAAGVCDGLGLGDNSKAALITRAIAEMRRLGIARNAQAETFAGLSGLGDLTATCFSKLSRNRALGERIGRGQPLPAPNDLPLTEGYPTTQSAHQLARQLGVETPIINEVYAMLYEGKPPAQAVQNLLTRDSKAED